ncbi:MAG TPA: helix-turn-helix transcriptional regulator [Candidatus Saccharimonadales bacterium]|nr:helix-turn-helix transcriptional regulator [Candidatus Saccharimonadales bacterium]
MPVHASRRGRVESSQEKAFFPVLAQAIRKGTLGKLLLSQTTDQQWQLSEQLDYPPRWTPREYCILPLVAQGLTAPECALELHLSRTVAYNSRRDIQRKFYAQNDPHAIREAVRRRALTPPAVQPNAIMSQRGVVTLGLASHGATRLQIQEMTGLSKDEIDMALLGMKRAMKARNISETVYKGFGAGVLADDMLIPSELLYEGVSCVMGQPLPIVDLEPSMQSSHAAQPAN